MQWALSTLDLAESCILAVLPTKAAVPAVPAPHTGLAVPESVAVTHLLVMPDTQHFTLGLAAERWLVYRPDL